MFNIFSKSNSAVQRTVKEGEEIIGFAKRY